MEVTFKLSSPREWLHFVKIGWSFRNRWFWKRYLVFMGLFVGGFMLLSIFGDLHKHKPIVLILRHWALVGAVELAVLPIAAALVACLTSTRTYRISEAGILTMTKLGRHLIQWRNVFQVVDFGEYIVLKSSEPAMMVIPKSAFVDDKEVNDFIGRISRYRQQAHAG